MIERDENNKGIISLQKRLDREIAGLYTLTIKCFEPSDKSVKNERKKYENMVSLDSFIYILFLLLYILCPETGGDPSEDPCN